MIAQFVKNSFCLENCQLCCRFSQPESIWSPSLLDSEIQELSRQGVPPSLITGHKKIRLASLGEDSPDLPTHVGAIFVCPFLGRQNNKCKIYTQRPLECELYPFLLNFRDKKIYLSVDPGCPYMKDNLESEEFKNYSQYLYKILNQATFLKTLKDNPQLIQVYEDALDLFELSHAA